MLGKIFSQREGQQKRGHLEGAEGGVTPLGRCLFWNFHSRQSGDAAKAFDNANVTWAIARLKIDKAAGQRGKGRQGGGRRLRMRKACDAGSLEKYRED